MEVLENNLRIDTESLALLMRASLELAAAVPPEALPFSISFVKNRQTLDWQTTAATCNSDLVVDGAGVLLVVDCLWPEVDHEDAINICLQLAKQLYDYRLAGSARDGRRSFGSFSELRAANHFGDCGQRDLEPRLTIALVFLHNGTVIKKVLFDIDIAGRPGGPPLAAFSCEQAAGRASDLQTSWFGRLSAFVRESYSPLAIVLRLCLFLTTPLRWFVRYTIIPLWRVLNSRGGCKPFVLALLALLLLAALFSRDWQRLAELVRQGGR